MFMIVLVNSGTKGDKFRKNREAIRQTWGNQSNCEQRKALGDERLKDLRWKLAFVVGKAGPGTNDDELNMAEARQHNDMLIGDIIDNYINPRANGAKRRSGRKPGARVTNSALAFTCIRIMRCYIAQWHSGIKSRPIRHFLCHGRW